MNDLQNLDAEYEGVKTPDREPPDSRYVVLSREAKLDVTRAGDSIIKWPLEIEDGDQRGRLLFKNIVIKSGKAMVWFKADLDICGLGDIKPSTLEANLSRFTGLRLAVNKKTMKHGGYAVYLNDRIDKKEG